MKTVALFGGSFNPPHKGHFEMAKYIHQELKVDEVWMIFSVNRLKDAADYAPLEHRVKMAEIMAQDYPDVPLIFSDIESRDESSHQTIDTLNMLQEENLDTRFIWVMGADNLESFHKWERYQDIIENFPIAVVDRPSYTDRALKGPTALEYNFLKIEDKASLKEQKSGWCFLDNPKIDISSSNLRHELVTGRNNFTGRFSEVANYICGNGLYGLNSVNENTQVFKDKHALVL